MERLVLQHSDTDLAGFEFRGIFPDSMFEQFNVDEPVEFQCCSDLLETHLEMAFEGDLVSMSHEDGALIITFKGPLRRSRFTIQTDDVEEPATFAGFEWQRLYSFKASKETFLDSISACESVIDVNVRASFQKVVFELDGFEIHGSVTTPAIDARLVGDEIAFHFPRFYLNRIGVFVDLAESLVEWHVLTGVCLCVWILIRMVDGFRLRTM